MIKCNANRRSAAVTNRAVGEASRLPPQRFSARFGEEVSRRLLLTIIIGTLFQMKRKFPLQRPAAAAVRLRENSIIIAGSAALRVIMLKVKKTKDR
jgi:hypothetical protein